MTAGYLFTDSSDVNLLRELFAGLSSEMAGKSCAEALFTGSGEI
jgi:hypothetical protein